MHKPNRRDFIALSAAAAAAAAGVSGTQADRAAAAETRTATSDAAAATGTLADAKHIVILMQENRSFDHYFGMLKGVRGFSDRSTVEIAGGHSVFEQPNGSGRQYPWQLSATKASGGADPERLAQCSGDLAHDWTSQHGAWNGGKMDAWVAAKGLRSLGYLTRDDIPFHYALADTWTICDAYHASGLTATGPNRTYLWSGKISESSKDGGSASGLTWQTYAEALEKAGVSWKVYQSTDNYGDNGLAYFSQFTSASASSPLRTKGMSTVPRGTTEPGDVAADICDALAADVRAGKLPQVSWIVPDQNYSEHPLGTPANGAHFVHMVINALNADPDVFNSTILFLNYDENDGYFDHVPPPAAPAGTDGEFLDGANIGLGFRVPMIAISPWSRGGYVNSQVSDHTSVLRFLEKWTAAIGKPATCPHISAWRRAVCGDLTSMFDFTSPVYGLPALPATTTTVDISQCTSLPNPAPVNNKLPSQEAGARKARALPYQSAADLMPFTSSGSVLMANIKMANAGSAACHFSVYTNGTQRSGGPWQYTVAAGGSTTDLYYCGPGYGDGVYDFTVIGPNRFLRRFKGNATKAGKDLLVAASAVTVSGTVKLRFMLTNNSGAAVTFTIKANAYRTGGPWTYSVPAGTTVTDDFSPLTYGSGWYDHTVTASSDTTWSQRFVGHLETGRPSISG
ncbi:phospholipase C, phosphocholine-specific [Streptomyces sp. SID8381]|uniref:phosphocholine-specific phospholipase C n=1 Tax=unclassified Streptomyces TaxID=2593676 RepID=UPI00036453EE|nr:MULTISPECIES: phospholipase C, phosphocholine-specific [unclassified Streptomyces]MYX28816.1 phospholipase C, phosphocholine-specific [Streptomyces sp. SID8381]